MTPLAYRDIVTTDWQVKAFKAKKFGSLGTVYLSDSCLLGEMVHYPTDYEEYETGTVALRGNQPPLWCMKILTYKTVIRTERCAKKFRQHLTNRRFKVVFTKLMASFESAGDSLSKHGRVTNDIKTSFTKWFNECLGGDE